jgi:hypothetical protein
MGIQGAVWPDQPCFGGGQLAAAVHHLANGPHALHFGGEGFDQFDAQVGCGVAASGRHHGVHRAAQGRVEQGGKPAAVHGAQWVHVVPARRALKDGLACADFHQGEVQRLGDAGVGQLAAEQALHDFQAGFAGHLVRAGHTRACASLQALAYHLLLGQPGFEQRGGCRWRGVHKMGLLQTGTV